MTSTSFPLTFPIEFDDIYDTILVRLKDRFTTPYYTEDEYNFDKLMQVYATPLTELSHTMDDVLESHQLSESTGHGLDHQWGVSLQLPRNINETDDHYRARLMTYAMIRLRSATPQDMISICAMVLGVATDRIVFADGALPASFNLSVFTSDITDAGISFSDFVDMMDATKAGGVGITTITGIGTFTCKGIGDASDPTKGYNNIANDDPDGGRYSGVI